MARKTSELVWFLDVLKRTDTNVDDWIVGVKAISIAAHVGTARLETFLTAEPPEYMYHVRSTGAQSWICKQSDIEQLVKDLDAYQARLLLTKAVKAPVNGTQSVAEPEPVVGRLMNLTGVPLVGAEQARQLGLGFENVKRAIEHLSSDLMSHASAMDANTKAIRDRMAQEQKLWGGDKKDE